MGRIKYRLPYNIRYYSKRYKKWVHVDKGFPSDGATGAIDIYSESWWVHDKICKTGTWQDGTCISNWQASQVLQDILVDEGRLFRSRYWFWLTWLRGGGKCRENGMFKCAEK
jgi:hypothetical protein